MSCVHDLYDKSTKQILTVFTSKNIIIETGSYKWLKNFKLKNYNIVILPYGRINNIYTLRIVIDNQNKL